LENIHDELDRLLVLTGHKKLPTSTRTAPQTSKPVERLELTLSSKSDKPAEKPSQLSIPDKLRACQHALDTKELADILQVSKLWILRKVKNRTIPHFKDGKILRFDPRLIADWWDKKSKH
jgi:excisionase family DNA binding protein